MGDAYSDAEKGTDGMEMEKVLETAGWTPCNIVFGLGSDRGMMCLAAGCMWTDPVAGGHPQWLGEAYRTHADRVRSVRKIMER